jgi:serine/threonine protein kinase
MYCASQNRNDNTVSSVIGKSIGNYQIQRLIGEGGMGRVYLAEHPGIGRQAAVKVLPPADVGDPQIVSRFINEARAANAIRHPNIVDIYDSGVLEGGTPYIIMEYLDGETLTQALAHGPLPLPDVFDWACQVAEALAAAHAHDVVHRDLKPDNLFLIPDPRRLGKKQVKVLDFGIAKLQHRTIQQVHKTRTGALLGTPLYMSPEQCMSLKDINARTDIYSLGVILYEMVTGKRPFDSEGVYAIISMHINETPIPPKTYRPDLPDEFETIILQALAKTPVKRQESMAVLLSQLELARGNPAGSSEALARAQQDRLKPIPLQYFPPAPVPEIKTLGDIAVSKPVTRRTGHGRSSTRLWLPLMLVSVGVGLYFLVPQVIKLSAPRPAPVSPEPTFQAPPPTPSAPAPPPPIDIGLDSTPAGANVYVGDVLVGTTPMRYQAKPTGEPVEFTFHREGFEVKKVRALPSPGLTVSAKFELPIPAKRPATAKRKPGTQTPLENSTDIKTER